jgi:dihydrofolate reductase
MTTIYTGATMSLDGYIAGPDETGFDHLFQWYGNGDVAVPTAHPDMTFQLTEASAAHQREIQEAFGVLVVGRKLFDVTSGWGGRHPLDKPVVVVTHRGVAEGFEGNELFRFVDSIDAAHAAAQELAGDGGIGLNGGTIASQFLDRGLVDEIWVDLVPVLLGAGTPFFTGLATKPVPLDGPVSIVEGKAVTHLRYLVRK